MIPLAPSSSEGLLIRGDFDLHTFRTTVSGCVDFILSFIDWHQCTVKVETITICPPPLLLVDLCRLLLRK